MRAKALLKHLFFFPFVIEGQSSHFSKLFALKELVLTGTVIAIERSNNFAWEGLGIITLILNLLQFALVLTFTMQPLNKVVEGMAEYLVQKTLLRKLLMVVIGLGNHVFFFLALIVCFKLSSVLFALNLFYVLFLLVGLIVHHCRSRTLTGWFVLRLPYLYVDAVMSKLLCEPYIRAAFFLTRYTLTPMVFCVLSYDILTHWSDYLNQFGCVSDSCTVQVTVLNTVIAGFALSLFALLEIPVGCMLISPK